MITGGGACSFIRNTRSPGFAKALALTFAVMAVQLSGCSFVSHLFGGGSDTPEIAGSILLRVKAADYVNPDAYGRPCPVVVRLYEISHCELYRQFRFLDLYNQPDHFLGAQLLYRKELDPLHPGQQRDLQLPLMKGTGCLVALAGYSQFRNGTPSAALPIAVSGKVYLKVEGLRVVLVRSD